MDEKKIQEIQEELLKEIDKEAKVESEIINSADEISSHLLISGKCQAEINQTPYMMAYRLIPLAEKKNLILVTAANMNLFKIAQTKYKPFTASAEVDERYSLKDNLKTVVEAFIRHVTGNIKPEVLDQ